jgi:hypothetical protein
VLNKAGTKKLFDCNKFNCKKMLNKKTKEIKRDTVHKTLYQMFVFIIIMTVILSCIPIDKIKTIESFWTAILPQIPIVAIIQETLKTLSGK